MAATVDSRLVRADWMVTAGVTAVFPLSFIDDNGDALPVDTWTFAARVLTSPGVTAGAVSLTVDTSQASVGQVSVTADNSVTSTLDGDYSWSLIWTVAGEPAGGLGGVFRVDPEGARGASGVVITS